MNSDNQITILVENYAYKTQFAEWGFSAHINYNGQRFLLDVGQSGSCVLKNAAKLHVDLTSLNGIILSHGHYDHTDGLKLVLQTQKSTAIYAHPNLFATRYSDSRDSLYYTGIKYTRHELESTLSATFHLHPGLTQIADRIYMTGEVPFTNSMETIPARFKVEVNSQIIPDTFPDDNSIIIDDPKGLIIIFGCAHRGIVNIMNFAKKEFNKKIYAIMGGTHLYNASPEHFAFVVDFIKHEDIKLIAPGHCSGIDQIFAFKDIFKERVTPAFCGEVFQI